MIEGACHCGSVHYRLTGEVDGATACNCTVCRRYGVLWAYDFENERIHVDGPTRAYQHGEHPTIGFYFCPICACVVYWRSLTQGDDGRRRIAVNLRLAEPDAVADIPIDHFDGLNTFDDLPRDGRCVRDYWF